MSLAEALWHETLHNMKAYAHLEHIQIAKTFRQRLWGLIGRQTLSVDEGVFFPQCRCIHTCFMRMPIRVIFWDVQGKVVKDIPVLRPWSWAYCHTAVGVLECAVSAGTGTFPYSY